MERSNSAKPAVSAPPSVGQTLLLHDLLLGERLYLFACVRYVVAVAILGGAFVGTYVVRVEGLDIPRLAACSAFLAAYNTFLFFYLRGRRSPERAAQAHRVLVGLSHLNITFDFVVLTYLIWLVGGATSPFLGFYLLHIILAGVLLSRWAAYLHAAFGYVLLAGLVVGEYTGWLPRNLVSGSAPAGEQGDFRYALTILVVYGILVGAASFFTTGLAHILREGERQLRHANEELARLSGMRRAFLHIALHDLKAPVSAIAMLLTNLSSGLGGPLTAEQTHWVARAQHRLRDLLAFLRDLQVLGELEMAKLEAQAQPLPCQALLEKVVEEHQELAQQRRHSLRIEAPPDLSLVHAVPRLLHEAVANYVSNAIKYTPEGGTITLRAACREGWLRIEVQDNGLGIAAQDQARLFSEFVRILPKSETAVAPAGTGLGLWIVRRIAELHHGRYGVESEPGKGSTFYLELPLGQATDGKHGKG